MRHLWYNLPLLPVEVGTVGFVVAGGGVEPDNIQEIMSGFAPFKSLSEKGTSQ